MVWCVDGVVIGFACTSISAPSASLGAARAIVRRAGWQADTGSAPTAKRESQQRLPGQRLAKRKAREQKYADPVLLPVPPPQWLCGVAALHGMGSGAGTTGPAPPEDRFARPPQLRTGGPDGPPVRLSVFSFGPCTARLLFGKTKRKWGVHPPGSSRPPEALRQVSHSAGQRMSLATGV